MVPNLLTVTEVAKLLRLHDETVRRHIRSGYMPHIRIGRRVFVIEADLAKWLEAQTADANE